MKYVFLQRFGLFALQGVPETYACLCLHLLFLFQDMNYAFMQRFGLFAPQGVSETYACLCLHL